jgi:hypothetical protein
MNSDDIVEWNSTTVQRIVNIVTSSTNVLARPIVELKEVSRTDRS